MGEPRGFALPNPNVRCSRIRPVVRFGPASGVKALFVGQGVTDGPLGVIGTYTIAGPWVGLRGQTAVTPGGRMGYRGSRVRMQ